MNSNNPNDNRMFYDSDDDNANPPRRESSNQEAETTMADDLSSYIAEQNFEDSSEDQEHEAPPSPKRRRGGAKFQDVLDQLRTNDPALKRIGARAIGGVRITDDRAVVLAAAMKKSQHLTDLYFDGYFHKTSGQGAASIASTLEVQTLPLRGLSFRKCKIGDTGAVALAKYLPFSKSLRNLGLGQCDIGNIGSKALADAIPLCTSLQTLTLDNFSSNTDQACIQAWTKALNDPRCPLRTIKFSSGYSRGPVWVELLGALGGAPAMRKLELSGFPMDEAGAIAMGNGLAKSSTANTIQISGGYWDTTDRIGKKGAEAIGNAIIKNTKLRCLRLPSGSVDDDCAPALAKALLVNKTLRELDISHNRMTYKGAQAFLDAFPTNTTLKSLQARSMGNGIMGLGNKEAFKKYEEVETLLARAVFINKHVQPAVKSIAKSHGCRISELVDEVAAVCRHYSCKCGRYIYNHMQECDVRVLDLVYTLVRTNADAVCLQKTWDDDEKDTVETKKSKQEAVTSKRARLSDCKLEAEMAERNMVQDETFNADDDHEEEESPRKRARQQKLEKPNNTLTRAETSKGNIRTALQGIDNSTKSASRETGQRRSRRIAAKKKH